MIRILNAVATTAVIVIVAGWMLGFHIVKTPTADQLYGCTYEQSDPATGECK